MPYISQEARKALVENGNKPLTAGELNYLVARLADEYLCDAVTGKITYKKLNEVIGVLECCKLEIYRRLVAPYEDAVLATNSEVFNAIAQ